jgi:hypothetical protein
LKGFLLLKSKSVQLTKVWIQPGAYSQEIAGPKDKQRIYTNFYGEAQKTVSGQQHPQIFTSLELEDSLGTKTK